MSSGGALQAVWCCSTCGAVYRKDYPRCPNDGGEVVEQRTDPLLGKTVGRYVIERLVGEGGMGRVYEARHASLANKHYAVKVLLGDAGATPSMRKRFTREAESASRLVHPNVVGVIDFGATEGGLPYIVMDFVAGRSLSEMIDDGAMDPPRVLRIIRGVCDGLAFAHAAGVVHRDLKPANIIVTADEVPRIADFGLAQSLDEHDVRLTSTGMAMGTPAYAAPEQMAGKRVDHRADLYALGMTMFELLSGGALPFNGGPMDVATTKAHREAPAFSDVCPDIKLPAGLEALLTRLLRRRANDRPADCAEVIAALEAITLDMAVDERAGTVHDRRSDVATTKRRTARRGWLVPAAIGAVALAGLGGWVAMHRGAETRTKAAPAEIANVAAPPTPAEVAQVAAPSPAAPDIGSPPPATSDVVAPPVAPPAEVAMPDEAVSSAKVAVAKASTPHHRTHRDDHARKGPAFLVTTEKPRRPADYVDPRGQGAVMYVPVAPPPELPPAPPPPKPVVLRAAIAAVDVHGSLPAADVRRAIDRTLPAMARCSPATAQNITAQLTIGESRRAGGLHASGGTAAECVSNALSAVRTESAPDVGEVEVVVHVTFAE